jgi:hypothetical protein
MFKRLASVWLCVQASAWAARPLAVSGEVVLGHQREGVCACGLRGECLVVTAKGFG